MYLLRAPYFKKTVAIIFLALFVLVHAIKAFHTHEISLASAHYHDDNTGTDVKAYFFCSICDFQIAKDCDAVISNTELATPEQSIPLVHAYILPVYNSILTGSSGTDPPRFV
jgi:hypothetical protein